MKVSSFFPVFCVNDPKAAAKEYEDVYGFSIVHEPIYEFVELIILINEHNDKVGLISKAEPDSQIGFRGMMAYVDDIEEAVKVYEGLDYELCFGIKEFKSTKLAGMKSGNASESMVVLISHVK